VKSSEDKRARDNNGKSTRAEIMLRRYQAQNDVKIRHIKRNARVPINALQQRACGALSA